MSVTQRAQFGVDSVRICVGLLPLGSLQHQKWFSSVPVVFIDTSVHMEQLLSQAGRCFGSAHGIVMSWLVTPPGTAWPNSREKNRRKRKQGN